MDHIDRRLLKTAAVAILSLSLMGAGLVQPSAPDLPGTVSSVTDTVTETVPAADAVIETVPVAPVGTPAPVIREPGAPAPAAPAPAAPGPAAPAPAAASTTAPNADVRVGTRASTQVAQAPVASPAVAPRVEAAAQGPAAKSAVPVSDGPADIIVKARPGRSAGLARAASAMDLRTTRSFRLTGAKVMRVPGNRSEADVLAELRADPSVQYAEPNLTFRASAVSPDDSYYPYLYGLNNTGQTVAGAAGVFDTDIDVPEAWSVTRGSSSVTVGVIDSGVDWTHPDLRDRIWTNPGETPGNGKDDDGNGYVDDVRGWDFFANDNNPMDENGHGTHVAGTIAASADSTGVVGVAPNVRIMPLRFLGADGAGTTAGVIGAIDYAVAKGVLVLNNSWGGPGFSQALYDAISASGTAFVTAAGNDGRHMDAVGAEPDYPGGYALPNVLNVAAVNNRGDLAPFSNYGATSVDVAAPGAGILSSIPALNGNPQGWAFYNGTSMAAPHVAGVAALVKSAFTSLSGTEVVDRIKATSVSLASVQAKVATGGLVNAARAVSAPATGTALSIRSSRTLITYGATATISGALTAGGTAAPMQSVTLYHRRSGGSWARLATLTTSLTGTYSYAHRTPYNSFYFARFNATPDYLAKSSTSAGVRVARKVTLAVSASSVRLGTSVSFAGRVAPASAGKPIRLQRYTSTGWKTVASGTVTRTNTYRFTFRTSARGTFSYRTYQPGDTLYAPAYSPRLILKVT